MAEQKKVQLITKKILQEKLNDGVTEARILSRNSDKVKLIQRVFKRWGIGVKYDELADPVTPPNLQPYNDPRFVVIAETISLESVQQDKLECEIFPIEIIACLCDCKTDQVFWNMKMVQSNNLDTQQFILIGSQEKCRSYEKQIELQNGVIAEKDAYNDATVVVTEEEFLHKDSALYVLTAISARGDVRRADWLDARLAGKDCADLRTPPSYLNGIRFFTSVKDQESIDIIKSRDGFVVHDKVTAGSIVVESPDFTPAEVAAIRKAQPLILKRGWIHNVKNNILVAPTPARHVLHDIPMPPPETQENLQHYNVRVELKDHFLKQCVKSAVKDVHGTLLEDDSIEYDLLITSMFKTETMPEARTPFFLRKMRLKQFPGVLDDLDKPILIQEEMTNVLAGEDFYMLIGDDNLTVHAICMIEALGGTIAISNEPDQFNTQHIIDTSVVWDGKSNPEVAKTWYNKPSRLFHATPFINYRGKEVFLLKNHQITSCPETGGPSKVTKGIPVKPGLKVTTEEGSSRKTGVVPAKPSSLSSPANKRVKTSISMPAVSTVASSLFTEEYPTTRFKIADVVASTAGNALEKIGFKKIPPPVLDAYNDYPFKIQSGIFTTYLETFHGDSCAVVRGSFSNAEENSLIAQLKEWLERICIKHAVTEDNGGDVLGFYAVLGTKMVRILSIRKTAIHRQIGSFDIRTDLLDVIQDMELLSPEFIYPRYVAYCVPGVKCFCQDKGVSSSVDIVHLKNDNIKPVVQLIPHVTGKLSSKTISYEYKTIRGYQQFTMGSGVDTKLLTSTVHEYKEALLRNCKNPFVVCNLHCKGDAALEARKLADDSCKCTVHSCSENATRMTLVQPRCVKYHRHVTDDPTKMFQIAGERSLQVIENKRLFSKIVEKECKAFIDKYRIRDITNEKLITELKARCISRCGITFASYRIFVMNDQFFIQNKLSGVTTAVCKIIGCFANACANYSEFCYKHTR